LKASKKANLVRANLPFCTTKPQKFTGFQKRKIVLKYQLLC